MKKAISVMVAAAMVLALFSGPVYAGHGNGNDRDKSREFKDMKGHWGSQSVQKMQYWGILNGYDDGTFQPDRTLTQGELAVIIAKLLDAKQGKQNDNYGNKKDLDEAALSKVPYWAKDAVSKGFMKHYLNTKRFHSQAQCDRITACVAIAKALDLEPVTDFTRNPFKDMGAISDEDFGYLLALYKEGYISGYPNGNFYPYSFLSRAQMACIIEKLLDELEERNETSDDDNAPFWSSGSTVTATEIRTDSVDLKWSAADDDVKVTGYKVLYEVSDTEKVKYTTARAISITGLEPDEDYFFTVEARDAAGNWSDDGPSIEVTTLKKKTADTLAPEWPSNARLTISASQSGVVTIVWPDANDNVRVESYKLYQDGLLIKVLDRDDNSAIVKDLKEDTEYAFQLKAVDKAGNVSDSLTGIFLTD